LCAIGDVVLGALAYAVVAVAFRSLTWLAQPTWRAPALVWILTGITLTVFVEVHALRSGLWDYEPAMPKFAGIGFSPLLQWVLVPAAVIGASRGILHHKSCRKRP